MSQLPKIDERNRQKPLTMDVKTGRFITYDEIIHNRAAITPLDQLTHEQLKELVIERQRVGPDYTMSDLNGNKLTRDEIVQEMIKETSFGAMLIKAETDYLNEFLAQIDSALHA
jgi:hypothetical protein